MTPTAEIARLTYRFRPAEDDSVDAEYEVLLYGTPTRYTIQCCTDGEFALVEHFFENGELVAIKHLAFSRDLERIKRIVEAGQMVCRDRSQS